MCCCLVRGSPGIGCHQPDSMCRCLCVTRIDISPGTLFLLLRASALIPKALAQPVTVESGPSPGRGAWKMGLQPWQPEGIGDFSESPNVGLWSYNQRASRELSLIRITSTLLAGLQELSVHVVVIFLSASFPLWLELIIYFKNTKQSFRKQERYYTPSSLTRAGMYLRLPPMSTSPQPIP